MHTHTHTHMHTYIHIQVNNNGKIAFNAPHGSFNPIPFPISLPLIAPYWADADTRPANGGYVWYREISSQADKDRIQREIRAIFKDSRRFTPTIAFVATWDHVGFFPQQTHKVLLKNNLH